MNNFNLICGILPLDPLSIFFVFVIALVSIPSAIYSLGYLKGYPAKKVLSSWVFLIIFVLSMVAVVTVKNALFFLIAWEVMALVSFFLVIFDSEEKKSIKAGLIYIIMTHIGTAFITTAFLIIYRYSGSFDFAAFKTACALMPAGTKNLVFLFLLTGFGTKAGIVPLHVWLPYAHPQAPSHISSIMSGVMIKTAVYGLIRFCIIILGVQSMWWGNLIMGLAGLSCLVGIMYALIENDIKKLLAYSSVENMGIILFGIGASMVFFNLNKPVLAVIALSAGLYHLINHAIFKSLLFLAAGSVYKATGLRDMEKLGGLTKKMAWTSFTFLIGAVAISALPPFNGFVSEWLTIQALFMGVLEGAGKVRVIMGVSAAVLALTGGLTAACFVKAFGVTFLAMPRSEEAKNAKESPFIMVSAMVFMAALALVFGVFSPVILKKLSAVSISVFGAQANGFNISSLFIISLPQHSGNANLSIAAIILALASVMGVTFILIYLIYGKGIVTIYKTWDCGYYKLNERTEYTSTAFSKPFRIAFDFFYRPYRKTEEIKETSYFVKSMKYETSITPIFKKYLYQKTISRMFNAANFVSKIQSGSIHFYIGYIFITILILLFFIL